MFVFVFVLVCVCERERERELVCVCVCVCRGGKRVGAHILMCEDEIQKIRRKGIPDPESASLYAETSSLYAKISSLYGESSFQTPYDLSNRKRHA